MQERWSQRHHDEIKTMLEHSHFLQHRILERIDTMSAELDRLTASVAKLTTAEKSLVALVAGLAELIRNNASDPAALNKLADDIDADSKEITDAVAANTPAAPPAEPPVEPAT